MRYDLAILGAGVTGLGAAVYASRLNLRTIVIGNAGLRSAAQDVGGTITLTDVVENYPGFIRLTGEELAKKTGGSRTFLPSGRDQECVGREYRPAAGVLPPAHGRGGSSGDNFALCNGYPPQGAPGPGT